MVEPQRRASDLAGLIRRGLADHQAGRLQQAEAAYREVLAAEPAHADALRLSGAIAFQGGRLQLAVDYFRRAIASNGASPEAHNNLGAALWGLGRFAEAEESYREALRLRPNYPEAHNNLGTTLRNLDRPAEAEACCREALRLRPDYPEAYNNLGNTLHDLGRFAEAETCCREAMRLQPGAPEAHNNLGNVLCSLGRFAEAAERCRAALGLRPDYPEAHRNLGNALFNLRHAEEAVASYRAAIRLRPDWPEAHEGLALALLLGGRLAEGWEENEWRWKTRLISKRGRDFAAPLWNGEALGERTVLVHAEQGFGDALQFCRYVPLIAANAGVVLEVQPALVRLLSGLPGVKAIVARGETLPSFDLHCPLLSLPRAFGTTLDTIPAAMPYLSACPARAAAWRQRLAGLDGLRVGLAWAGEQRSGAGRAANRRSMALEMMAPLGGTPGVSFIALQKGEPAAQAASPPPGMVLHDFTADLHDFAETAALVANLDLVISVDTAVAHLAGALGRPVWLLNRFEACWRWLLDREDSPWYPTLRQFRQPSPGDWGSVMQAGRAALQRLAAGDRGQLRPCATGCGESAPDLGTLFRRGLADHQAGRLQQAEAAYRQVLAVESAHADALHLVGVIAHQCGHHDQAIDHIRRAIGVRPAFPEAHNNLGSALRSRGRPAEAAQSYREALRLRPDYPEAHNNLGIALRDLDRAEEARASYREALRLRPDYPEAHANLGNVLRNLGHLAEAEASYREALRLRSSFPEAHNNLGAALRDLGRPAEAEASYREALRLRPDYPEAHTNLGNLLLRLDRPAEAEASYRQALRLRPADPEGHLGLGNILLGLGRTAGAEAAYREALRLRPDYPEAHNDLGIVLRDLGRFAEAAESCREALRLRPDWPEAHNNLGVALRELDRPAEAEASCREALRLRPDYPEAHTNLGNLLRDLGRLAEAEASCREAVRLRPDHPDAHLNLGNVLLTSGRFDAGWKEYEWRWKTRHVSKYARNFPAPLWNGEAIGERVILLHAEQGFGDTLQFCRYVPLVARQARVVLEVQAPLVRLLSRLPGIMAAVARGDALPPFDLHCPLLSLPRAFGTTLDTIPAGIPYLSACPARAAEWRERLAGLDGLRVGLVWAGGWRSDPATRAVDWRRSIPLAMTAPFGDASGVSFVSLQKGEPTQSASPPPGMVLHDFTADLHDFADTAALVANLDLVISVDTAVAHLAGALGRPVWLLNRFDTDWRWLLGREDSPWYPTLRQFRQPRPGDWGSVMQAVCAALRRLAAGDREQLRSPVCQAASAASETSRSA